MVIDFKDVLIPFINHSFLSITKISIALSFEDISSFLLLPPISLHNSSRHSMINAFTLQITPRVERKKLQFPLKNTKDI